MQTNAHPSPSGANGPCGSGENGACAASGFDGFANSMRTFGMLGKYTVVPNVVDTQLFRPTDDAGADVCPTSAHCATTRKRQRPVARCSHRIGVLFQPVVAIIGDGDPAPFQVQAKELGIDDVVEISGEITLDEVVERMRHSDALLLLPLREFPLRDSSLGKWNCSPSDVGASEHHSRERLPIASEDDLHWLSH